MRAILLAVAALVVVVAVACGPSGPEPSKPVASTPLAGTIDGKAWTAVSGTARSRSFSDGGEKWIDIGAGSFSCATFVPEAELIGTIPWVAGTTYDLSLANNLTILNRSADGGIVNKITTNGRLELISAPTGPDAGKATIRIRASYGTDNSIEGQFELSVCN